MNKLQKLINEHKLMEACQLVSSLPKNDPMLNPKEGENPLLESIAWLHIPLLSMLIDKGADVNYQDENGMTPLLVAILANKKNAVDLLLDHPDINPNLYDNANNIPLIIAIEKQNTTLALKLIQKGANLNDIDRKGYAALSLAVIYNLDEVCLKMIEKNADLNIVDSIGRSALFYAKNEDIIRILLDNGIDPSIQDNSGLTAIEYEVKDCIKYRLIEQANILLEFDKEVELTIEKIKANKKRNKNIPKIKQSKKI